MRVWRIYSHLTPYARRPDFDPLSGAGGVKHAARWHHPGHKVVYTAANASLATLEIVVHVQPDLFGERRLLELEVPEDSLERVSEQAFIQLLRGRLRPSPRRPRGRSEANGFSSGARWF